MKAIIAINNLSYIGLNGTLPWRCSADLKHFKALTLGGNLLVGYNTSLALPPLKDRTVIVDKRDVLDDNNEIDWCIGGKKTYEKYAPYFTELHISIIHDSTIGDTVAPDWKNLNPECKVFVYYFEPNAPKACIADEPEPVKEEKPFLIAGLTSEEWLASTEDPNNEVKSYDPETFLPIYGRKT